MRKRATGTPTGSAILKVIGVCCCWWPCKHRASVVSWQLHTSGLFEFYSISSPLVAAQAAVTFQ